MKIKQIHQIELSSRCNFACSYCPQRIMRRPKVDISRANFRAALAWAKHFDAVNYNGEVVLVGTGEPLLHPEFCSLIEIARRTLGPGKKILTTTNGKYLTAEIVREIKKHRIQLWISRHAPAIAAAAGEICNSLGVEFQYSNHAVDTPNDWAGQVDLPGGTKYHAPCPWRTEGMAMVGADGTILRCCYVTGPTRADGVLGTVRSDLTTLDLPKIDLCSKCWQDIPGEE